MNTWTSLSNEIAAAVDKAAPSIVQVHGHRRVTAGLVIADNLIATPAATDDDTVAVLTGDRLRRGRQRPKAPCSAASATWGSPWCAWTGSNRPALGAGAGTETGTARRGRRPHLERRHHGDARADRRRRRPAADRPDGRDRSRHSHPQSPHGALNGGALINAEGQALGIITSVAIRGTTVVIPASIAWAAATKVASRRRREARLPRRQLDAGGAARAAARADDRKRRAC